MPDSVQLSHPVFNGLGWLPAEQCVHEDSSAERYVPGSQGVQPLRSSELVLPEGQKMQIPIWLYCPGSHGRHWVCASSGCVPGGHAAHEMPFVLISFSPHPSQKVEESLNEHWVPGLHGFSVHLSTDDATVHTAVLDSSAGSSMVVFVMRSVVAAVTDSDAPLGASLVRKIVSLMVTASGPEVATPPPWPEVTRKS